jgi:hypothetical protein
MPTATGNAGFDAAVFAAEQQYQQAEALAIYNNAGTGTSFSHDPLIVSGFPVRFARFGRVRDVELNKARTDRSDQFALILYQHEAQISPARCDLAH